MFLVEIGQVVQNYAHVVDTHVIDGFAAPAPKEINTDGIVLFFASKVAPVLLAVLGAFFIARASRGEVSRVLTSSAIAIIGLAFIAGAATLFFVGESLINLMFK